MGADYLYLSPCCHIEDYDFTYRREGVDYYKCGMCGNIFPESQLQTETLDYDRDETER